MKGGESAREREVAYRHRFHEVAALRALMCAARPPRENGNDIMYVLAYAQDHVIKS